MDRIETVARLDAYIKAMEQKKENEEEIEKLESKIRTPADPSYNYTLIRFLWPFLVLYPVLVTLISVSFALLVKAQTESDLYFIVIISLGVYFITSVFIAKALRKRKCEKEYKERVLIKEKEDEIRKRRIQDLENENKEHLEIIQANKDLLPASCRNLESAKKIKTYLIKGKFDTIEEAVEFIF